MQNTTVPSHNKLTVLTQDDIDRLKGLNQIVTDDEVKNEIESIVTRLKSNTAIVEDKELRDATDAVLTNADDQTALERFQTIFIKVMKRTYIKTGQYLQESVHDLDAPFVDEMRNGLIKEYQAHSVSELIIIDLAVSTFFRALRSSKVYNRLIENSNGTAIYFEQERVNMIKALGKQIDKDNRLYLTLTTFLKESHRPPLKVSIQTKETYVAQNQQFNRLQPKLTR